MWGRAWLVCLLVLSPAVASAQTVPERLLPGGSQIYLRYDGIDKHRASFDNTAVGKMLKDDTGKFLAALWTYGNDLLDVGLRHLPPDAGPEVASLIKEVPGILAAIHHNGFVLGVEAKTFNPPQVQLVVVFPKGGGDKGSILALIDKIAAMAKGDVKRTKVGPRDVREISSGPVHFGWWSEPGDDAVLVFGTTSAVDLAKAAASPSGSFADSKTLSTMAGFKEFPVWARGHVDVAGILQKVGEVAPPAEKIIGDLGLKGIQGVTFYSGFQGAAERTVVEFHAPAPRKGLLALMNRKNITLADLPPLPSDVTSFSASNFNLRNVYDGGIMIAETAINTYAPGSFDPKESIRQIEGLLGVKISEDLFGSFESVFVTYSSPAEGPLGLGGVYLFKVKDEKKLSDALEGLFKAIPPFPGAEVSFKKRAYRGGEVMALKLTTFQGDFPIAHLAVHKGWFIFASYPQSLYGFILRSNGELPTWKADASLTKALTAFPKEFTSISISDPRPSVTTLLSVAPSVLTLANTILPNVLQGAPMFDISVIPHAQDAVRHLFPNITVTVDDGSKIRTDTRASLALPF